ncbi:hypothetical protein E7Y32_07055 [Arthrobacter sp. UKPF54-2]|uniref:hypothetical protein n=1 Tax=Arthrobacter sp. UKPF54-2 TaxID=2600159 RepID=UPI0011B190C1|nr:hypothetical protein [Arthrobacter sp. UKPF54-2]QDY89994.1 hypothetical protein E7Y32_07055 [Arthrobacter sp. UKPF54-2]
MSWQPPLPKSAVDASGQTWQVRRAWPDRTPGDYKLEVLAAGRPGVRAAHLRSGHFELVPRDDPGLPALRAEARHGEIVAHRPHARAVVRAAGCYVKVFRPGEATAPAERLTHTEILLGAGPFRAPKVLRSSADVIVFSSLPGRTLGELAQDHVALTDASFALLWEDWSQAWSTQVNARYGTAGHDALAALPVRSPDVEAADARRWVDRWLRHYGNIPEASAQRDALCAAAENVTRGLLGSAPDPLVWAHGDLHDKQIIALDGGFGLPGFGLLDFDDAARAEAALDLANLDVHLEFLVRQGRITPARFLAAHRQVMAVAGRLRVSEPRFRAYSDAAWLRLACSPLPGRLALALAALEERAPHPPAHRVQEPVP